MPDNMEVDIHPEAKSNRIPFNKNHKLPALLLMLLLMPLLMIVVLNLIACYKPYDTPIRDIHGKNIDIKNRWLIINYWTDWCKPCIKELPELNALNDQPNIQVVGINFDQPDHTTLISQIKRLSITFPITTEPLHEMYGYPLPEAIPMTIMISPNKKLRFILYGSQTKAGLMAKIKKRSFG